MKCCVSRGIRYVALYATELIKQQRTGEALGVFVEHGAPAKSQNLNIYRHLAAESLLDDKNDHTTWIPLRNIFYQLVISPFPSPVDFYRSNTIKDIVN